ncbi:MAG: VWA domain-containing protein [Thioploca sp.]|nr:VWA domain-containing protein [Thioploca sp.]
MPIRHSYRIKLTRFYRLLWYFALFLSACSDSDQNTTTTPSAAPTTPTQLVSTPRILKLLFIYDGEKQAWVEEVTSQFNQAHYPISDGQIIQVETIPRNSWQIIDEVLSDNRQAHLLGPATDLFIKLGNTKSQLKTGQDLVGYTESLLLSPIVIAMWKPLAETLGWGRQQIGWADIVALANNPQGWGAYHYPQWGKFKLGHPHPEYSYQGFLSLFTQIYAAADKLTNLTLADINRPPVGTYLHDIQQTVTHYGHSSRFVQQEFLQGGPTYLSAALCSESQVIQSYQQQASLAFPVVAIYPKEGTLWSEHPIGIVERDWVTPFHQEAALVYIEYLLAKPQQERALQYGFRPTNVQVPLSTPIDTAHGVNPKEPKVTLETPSIELMMATLRLWHQQKKSANIMLVLDTSGSMRGDKIRHAHDIILQLLEKLGDNDHFSLLSFNHRFNWVVEDARVGSQREKLQRQVKYQFPGGGTALYDAIAQAYHFLTTHSYPDKISVMIILTEGGDSHSQLNSKTLIDKMGFSREQQPINIFTIGYDSAAADKKLLTEIAQHTHGKFYDGTTTPTNILKDMAIFF